MSGVIYQVLGALILDFNCFIYGFTSALPATTMVLFTSDKTALNRTMTQTEASLMASLASVAAIIGMPMAGYLMDYLGRKRCAIVVAIFPVLCWSMLVSTSRVEIVLAAVFIQGLHGAMFLVGPVFTSELSQDSIRGFLASGAIVSSGTGVLSMFLAGEFLEYNKIKYIGLTAATLAVVSLSILKESPTLLMKKGLEAEAAKSMAFYRNSKPNSKIVMQEIDNIRRALAPEPQAMKPEEDKLVADFGIAPDEKLSKWQFFKKSRSTRRAFLLVTAIMMSAIFQGMLTIQMYSIQLFGDAVPKEVLSPNWCGALVCTVSVMTGLIAGYLTDVAGRRTLLIYSCISAGVCMLALGSQVQLHWAPQWATAALIYIFCVVYTFGPGTVPFVLLGEIFLPEVRSVLSMVCMQLNWFCAFLALFLFNPIVNLLGLGPVFYFFSIVGFSTAVFAYFFLPETKGLSVDVIQTLLVKGERREFGE